MIKIDDTYYIDANNTCYTLKERTVISDKESKNYGEELYKDLGYFNSLEHLLNYLLKKETRKFISDEKVNTLEKLIDEIHRYENYLKSLNLKA